jgi:DNA (cytosine-5)-methyltransferase 3A
MEDYLERKEAGTATRSDLFWEFIRMWKETKPKYFMLENVKMKKEYMEIFNKAI